MKRIKNIEELQAIINNQDKYIFYLDTAGACNKNLSIYFQISYKSPKRHYCGKMVKYTIYPSSEDECVTINNRVFNYKNISYIEKEIEIILDIKI